MSEYPAEDATMPSTHDSPVSPESAAAATESSGAVEATSDTPVVAPEEAPPADDAAQQVAESPLSEAQPAVAEPAARTTAAESETPAAAEADPTSEPQPQVESVAPTAPPVARPVSEDQPPVAETVSEPQPAAAEADVQTAAETETPAETDATSEPQPQTQAEADATSEPQPQTQVESVAPSTPSVAEGQTPVGQPATAVAEPVTEPEPDVAEPAAQTTAAEAETPAEADATSEPQPQTQVESVAPSTPSVAEGQTPVSEPATAVAEPAARTAVAEPVSEDQPPVAETVSEPQPAAAEADVQTTAAETETPAETDATREPQPQTPAEAVALTPSGAEAESPVAEAVAQTPSDAEAESPVAEPVTEPEPAVAEPAAQATAAEAETPGEADATSEPQPQVETVAPTAAATAEQDALTAAPKPGPPRIPTPAALAGRVHAPATSVPAPPPPSESARFGRVEDDGTVYVTDGDTERAVGSYPDASNDDALQYFARKYDELLAQADLLHQRLTSAEVPGKEAADSLAALQEHTAEPLVVGDLAALRDKVAGISTLVTERRAAEVAERAAARAQAATEREALVAEAETIAAQPVDKVQWKSSSERMRGLLDQWKQHQRSGPKLDKPTENALWQRFSHARNSFDKARRTHFAQLEDTQSGAKRAKENLVKEAEQLATSKDWTPTARAFKGLMDQWRLAGRASRADDDALWSRFKAAQDSFFAAKDEVNAAEDAEFRANLAIKEQLITEAQAILPVSNLEAAKTQLRLIQDKWDKAGKVPRADIERIEKAMRRVETTIRDADDAKWKASNPEVAARANSMVTQLEASIAGLRDDLAKADSAGNARKAKDLRAKVEAQEAWLAQARAGLGG